MQISVLQETYTELALTQVLKTISTFLIISLLKVKGKAVRVLN